MNEDAENLEEFEPWVDAHAVAAHLSCGIATVYRRVNSGHIPKPRRIGSTMARWRLSEVDTYILEKQAA